MGTRRSPHHRDRIAFVSQSFEIGPVQVGTGRLFLIAGPCVIESETHARTMAEAIQRITSDLGVPYIFKASYDKANRTSIHSFRGPGLVEGTRILRSISETLRVVRALRSGRLCPADWQPGEEFGPADQKF